MNDIRIIDEVSLRQCATPDEGLPIYNKIMTSLGKGEMVSLDFEQVELVTAKVYYKNQEQFDNDVDSVLYGEN